MIIALLLAVAVPASTAQEMSDAVCGPALDVLLDLSVPKADLQERYLGRMEIALDKLNLKGEKRAAYRQVCEVYASGAIRAMDGTTQNRSLDRKDVIRK